MKILSAGMPENIISSIRKAGFNVIISTGNLLADPNVLDAKILFVYLKVVCADFFQIIKLQNPNLYVVAVYANTSSVEDKNCAQMAGANFFLAENTDVFGVKGFLNLFKRINEIEKKNASALIPKQGVLDKLENPVFIKDLKGQFIAGNSAFARHLGLPLKDVIGKNSVDFMQHKRSFIHIEMDRKVLKDLKPRRYEGRTLIADGGNKNVIVIKSPYFDQNNELTGILGVITDITKRKKREKELKVAKQKAQKADKLKTSFLSNMSHEIRTPMNAIVGFSQLLSTEGLSSEKKKIYIDQVNYNAQQLLKLIEDIIEISKIEAGEVKIVKSICYVNQILDDIKISFETHKARQGKQHIGLIIQKGNPDQNFSIYTDPYRLNQIITNLIGNAVKFTEEGSISFGYNFIKKDNKDFLNFFVIDTGLGIKKEKLEFIFDRFSKVPAGKTKLYGGTGLGLSISKSLTEILGGRIKLVSEENKGTSFYFTIPTGKKDTAEIGNAPKIIEKIDVAENKYFWPNRKVLIVDDEEMNFLFLQEVLRETKAKLTWAKNGKIATQHILANENFDIILMDIRMPVMDGIEATAKIKSYRNEIPIIIQSAYAMEADKKKAFEAGCDNYIEKPINAGNLLLKIKDLLHKNEIQKKE